MLISEKNKLNISDLKLGMKVKASQLSDIYDTYIILTNVHLVKNVIGTRCLISHRVRNALHEHRAGVIFLTLF